MGQKTLTYFLFLSLALFSVNLSATIQLQQPEHQIKFDENFKERYNGNSFNYEGKEIVTKTPTVDGNYSDYKKDENITVKEQNNSNGFSFNLSPLNWLFVIIFIIALFYLLYVLLDEGGNGLFTSKANKKITDYSEITAENIENADINALIYNAENDNNYRLAIRYYYLLVLKTLTQKNYIKFEDDKTNADYLNEVNQQPFSTDFSYISYIYSYIWYGQFGITNEDYTKAKGKFNYLINRVK